MEAFCSASESSPELLPPIQELNFPAQDPQLPPLPEPPPAQVLPPQLEPPPQEQRGHPAAVVDFRTEQNAGQRHRVGFQIHCTCSFPFANFAASREIAGVVPRRRHAARGSGSATGALAQAPMT